MFEKVKPKTAKSYVLEQSAGNPFEEEEIDDTNPFAEDLTKNVSSSNPFEEDASPIKEKQTTSPHRLSKPRNIFKKKKAPLAPKKAKSPEKESKAIIDDDTDIKTRWVFNCFVVCTTLLLSPLLVWYSLIFVYCCYNIMLPCTHRDYELLL